MWSARLGGVLLVMLATVPLTASPPPYAIYGVVRIPSHGGSGTVIFTEPGRSLVLSCAHLFESPGRDSMGRRTMVPDPALLAKHLVFELPWFQPGPPRYVGTRVLDVDHEHDLSLLEVREGPLAFVSPVPTDPAYRPSTYIVSCGYDSMQGEQVRPATLLSAEGHIQYTREQPRPGRSGGGLIDRRYGFCIGVCEGYEVRPNGRGMYIALPQIQAFLARQKADPFAPLQAARPQPAVREERDYGRPPPYVLPAVPSYPVPAVREERSYPPYQQPYLAAPPPCPGGA